MNADTTDPLMSIGTFSRASLVSIKALRRYHEQGLLVPAEIDAVTGYRSYRVSQLADAQIIKRLRALDVPLRSVAKVVHARDPDVTRLVIAEHETTMRTRLAELEQIVDELGRAVDLPVTHTPVHLRRVPPQAIIALRRRVPLSDVGVFLAEAFERLRAVLDDASILATGPGAALYDADFPDEIDDVTAFYPVDRAVVIDRDPTIENRLLPGGVFAVLTHTGSFDSMERTYRQLGAWVAHNAEPLSAPIREHYVVSVDDKGQLLPDDQLRTDIEWPVANDSAAPDLPTNDTTEV